jgi:hypothetical protein
MWLDCTAARLSRALRRKGRGHRKLRNDEPRHSCFSLSTILRTIESRRIRWAGHVGRMGKKRHARSKENHCEDQNAGVWVG